jgi:hypothetical protein
MGTTNLDVLAVNGLEIGEKIKTNVVIGNVADLKVARGVSSITGSGDIASGLTTVVAVVACLGQDPNVDAATATADLSVTAGNIVLKVWKLVEGAPNTLGASTIAKDVNWIAIGT